MAIYYCSWATGNDTTGDGTYGNPYKTITTASTGRSGGDEVRVAKSPDPTALTGSLTFTNGSANVSGSGTAFTTELAIGDFIEADGNWWEVITLTSATACVLYKVFGGTTQSGISSRKLGVTSTGAATATGTVQAVSVSGTSGNNLLISGGWDLSTQTQTGQTWFRQMHGTFNNRYGYGLYLSGTSFTTISRLHFLRYDTGINYITGGNNNVVNSPTCNSNTYGIYYNASHNNVATTPTCNGNWSGIHHVGGSNNVVNSPTCISNTNGLNYTATSNDNLAVNPTCKSSAFYAINNNSSRNRIAGTLTTASSTTGAISNVGNATLTITKAAIAEATIAAGFTNYVNGRVCIGDIGGYSQIWTDGGNIISQAATAGGTGKEWRFNVTSANRYSGYPLSMKVAAVAVAANAQVTVTVYFKKSATSIAGRLLCRGGQLAGVDSDVSTTCPNDTSRNNVTITFTPTEAGVIEIEAEAWYVSATDQSVIIDDISITQA